MRHWRQFTSIVIPVLAGLVLAVPALAQDGGAAESVEAPPLFIIVMFLGIGAIAVVGAMALIRMMGDE
jgi:hypothetical protein